MPKPGYRTTEFYATLAALLVAALVAFGIVEPITKEDAPGLEAALADGIAARVVVEYIRNRTTVKLNGLPRASAQAYGTREST